MQKLQKLIDNKSEKNVKILKYNPFFVKSSTKEVLGKNSNIVDKKRKFNKRDLDLVAILNNRAFVGGKWVAKNDIIYGYKVEKILKDSVILANNKKKLILKFQKTKEILKVRTR